MQSFRRKIQLVAGGTYTISLPKSWIKMQGIKEQDEVLFTQNDDQSLVLNASDTSSTFNDHVSLSFEMYASKIDAVLFALYYKGVEHIDIFSSSSIPSEYRQRIRKAVLTMSGTEIVYEDEKKISIHVMLNKVNVNLFQVFYRMILILKASIKNLIDEFDWSEIQLNEDELDRLHNLSMKLLSSSLHNSSVLQTTGIGSISIIPPLFIVNKRLENIADNLYVIGRYHKNDNIDFSSAKPTLQLLLHELERSSHYLLGKQDDLFKCADTNTLKKFDDALEAIDEVKVRMLVREAIRFLHNIQEEIFMVSFYRQGLDQKN